MALRWSKTQGAYNKYKHLLGKTLPITFPCTSGQIHKASHIRDVIKYANENHLPGGHLYKKVKVSPQDEGVVIYQVNNTQKSSRPIETIFSLINSKELIVGYEFDSVANVKDVKETLKSLGIEIDTTQGYFIVSRVIKESK